VSTPALSRDEGIEMLEERLHFLLEKYDPSDDPDWEGLADHQREIFRAVVRGLTVDRAYWAAAFDPSAI